MISFVLKVVLVLLVFSFIVYVFKAIARLRYNLRSLQKQFAGGGVASTEMLRCASCGAFVSSGDAITVSQRNNKKSYCSQNCFNTEAQR